MKAVPPVFIWLCYATIAVAQVPYERIVTASEYPAEWLTYSGSYKSHRFTWLSEIHAGNVSRLRPSWVYQGRHNTYLEATPLVSNGLMYVSEPLGSVVALDVRSGRPVWTYSPSVAEHAVGMKVNRGVALLDDKIFVGRFDARLVALDAQTGIIRWDSVVADFDQGYHITAAPLAIQGKVVVGISGGDQGVRGFIDAYDPNTGKRLWRTYTVPSAGERASDTWGGTATPLGGATWVTGSFDPDLNLLYWGTGNPAPLWNGDDRPGDNLYTCSLLAIDPKNGQIKWHFQFTPHDVHDWDANQVPVLFEAKVGSRMRKLIATANRNGFYYVLDRETGEFLTGVPFVKQTWAEGLDSTGRPILRPTAEPTASGTLAYPSLGRAANWWSPSYSPLTNYFYQASAETGTTYYKGEVNTGDLRGFAGGGTKPLPSDEGWGVIRAFESTTGMLKWEFKLLGAPMAGLLSTAGNLVFGGSLEGNFFALDARNGSPLWDFQVGSTIRANPISYAVDGEQFVAIAAGRAIFAFGLR